MKDHDVFWKLEALSDQQLLERLGSVLGSSRRLMAELIAHLGEVEERRLHLVAACSSMFAYCTKLGMTEDESYRRIEVARLARRYPAIFQLLANGQLSLSVVALLKHHLSEENHEGLLATVTGKSVAQTREFIAARFPRPDVPSSVRKLPERRTMPKPSLALSTPPESASGTAPSTGVTEPRADVTAPPTSHTEPRFTPDVSSSTEVPDGAAPADVARNGRLDEVHSSGQGHACYRAGEPPPDAQRAAPPPPPSRIEPLSAQRYKVQFTASADLARKLELARDLMRHRHPGGELGPIVEQALDLLIEGLMQRRFGKRARPKRTSASARSTGPEPRRNGMNDRPTMRGAAEPGTTLADAPPHQTPTRDTAARTTTTTPATADVVTTSASATPESGDVQVDRRDELTRASVNAYIPRSTRSAVVERDGLGCSWLDAHGVRCGSRAWLEYDITGTREPKAAARNPTTCGSFAEAITVSRRN